MVNELCFIGNIDLSNPFAELIFNALIVLFVFVYITLVIGLCLKILKWILK